LKGAEVGFSDFTWIVDYLILHDCHSSIEGESEGRFSDFEVIGIRGDSRCKIFVNLVLLSITKSDILYLFLSGGVGKHPHRQHLTSLWLDECLDSLELMEVAYYHRPLPASPLTALRGVVTCVSGRSCS
jgi:hypothetical protein